MSRLLLATPFLFVLTAGARVTNPDLKQVDEIGWTELAPGGGTPSSSRVDWIEVYGQRVARR